MLIKIKQFAKLTKRIFVEAAKFTPLQIEVYN